ncbi:MAG: hypothetical protein HY928_01200 [Elusimicrobia bacterium]|nr:hypothetical protein [Elusimicrobiota bacterium]
MAFDRRALPQSLATLLLLCALAAGAKAPPEPGGLPKPERPVPSSPQDDDAAVEKFRDMIYKTYPSHPGKIVDPVTVSTQAGSLRLSFSVAKTRIKKDESLWFAVTLTNVGKSTITLTDPSFQWHKDLLRNNTLRLEFRDPAGGIIVRMPPNFGMRPSFCPEVPDPEYDARALPKLLPPGASISTPADADVSGIEVSCMGRSRRSNIPPYGEITLLTWDVGKNRVRARLFGGMRVGAQKPNGRYSVEFFDMATEWVTMEVEQ